MPWQEYLAAHTEFEHRVWWEFFRRHRWSDVSWIDEDPDGTAFVVGEHVDQETWDRWNDKVASVKFKIAMQDQKKMTPEEIANHVRMIETRARMAKQIGPRFGEEERP